MTTRPAATRITPERVGATERARTGHDVRWLVGVVTSIALGIGSLSLADSLSRDGWSYGGASVFFWVGLLLMFAPVAVRVLMPQTSRRDRLALVVLLAIGLYLVKVLASPSAFTFSDEYTHLRDLQDIARTHHLFAANPIVPTAGYYPGLGAVTAGLVDLTGLRPFVAGLLLIGVTRVLFVTSFFLVASRLTRSDRAAAAATLIYLANPMFLFFSSTFSYENLGLPLAAFAVWLIARTRRWDDPIAWAIPAIPIIAVAVTHHVSALALSTLLVAGWVIERWIHGPSRANFRAGVMALVASVATLVWLLLIARPAAHYLFSQNIEPAIRNTGSVLLHQSSRRHLYASGGVTSPRWESLAGFAATGLLLLALPFGIYRAWPGRRRAAMAVAILAAVAYPLSLAPRLAPTGVAISGRSSEYVFGGLGCVLGLLVLASNRRGGRHARVSPAAGLFARYRSILYAAGLIIVFVGNVTIGTAFYERLSETSHPSGYPFLVQPDAVSASTWAKSHLGTNQRFAANAIDSNALATYGGQDPALARDVWPIFFPTSIDRTAVQTIRTYHIHYLLVDNRMTQGVPPTPGYYFGPAEPGAGTYKHAFPAAALRKFSTSHCIRTVFAVGEVRIDDVSRIENGTCSAGPAGRSTSQTAAR